MRETITRAISGLLYILLLVIAISHSYTSLMILFGGFLFISVWEFSSLVALNKKTAILLSLLLFLLGILQKDTLLNNSLILIASLLASGKALSFLFKRDFVRLDTFSKYIYLIGYLTFSFVIITKIPFEDSLYNPKRLLSIFIMIWTNDTFAYLVGKSLGKHKLLERVSPKKTIEGFIGGLFFTLIAGWSLAEFYLSIPVITGLLLALVVSVFGTLGDLIESKFKRIYGVKDSGSIMPGHGGILDRLDSIIFVTPIVFLLYQILKYVS